ncbi:MAG TPA: hypothetical protein ACFYEF_01650 [Candidatus Wunengus sp. YC63]|uniref:hypothetical protein n=1 Tax=Candidatus Wunengus sp. YC63 TaxID=3367699 RepID=UPI0040268870
MDKNNKNDRLISRKDDMIGEYLSSMVNKEKANTKCPSDVEIAVFLDGRLNDTDRDAIMGHISSCDDCYELFTEGINIQEELSKEEEPSKVSWLNPKFLISKFVPYSLAAAAAILAMSYLLRDYSIGNLSFVNDRVAILTEDAGRASLPDMNREGAVYSYGFADVTTPKNTSFRIGICLTDIKIGVTAENKESISGLLSNMVVLLKNTKVSGKTILFYEGMTKEIEESGTLRQLTGGIDVMILREVDEPLFVWFGQWCEGGRIAAVKRTERFYDMDDVRTFIRMLKKENLPEGVLRSLNEIEGVVKAGVYTEVQFKRLEKEYVNLISLF